MGDTLKYTDDATASGLAVTGRGNFHVLYLILDGTNSVTVNIYDSLTASGTKLIPETVFTPSDIGEAKGVSFIIPVEFSTGVYVDIVTSGTVTYKVYYNRIFN